MLDNPSESLGLGLGLEGPSRGLGEMLDKPSDPSPSSLSLAPTPNIPNSTVKQYAPPNQRNRLLNRRKSGERLDRAYNVYGNEEEKNQVSASRNVPMIDHRDVGSSNLLNDNPYQRLISLDGCCSGEAFQLLNDRWAAAMKCYDDPLVDLSGLSC